MIVTSRCARWLQSLPDGDSAALLDAVARCAAAPLANPRHCKHLGPDLYEARVSLPPSRQYRLMFGFRNGQPVLLSACLKKNNIDHEKAVRAARRALSSDEPKELLMAKNEPPLFSTTAGWVYSGRRQFRIVHATRRKVIVETDDGPVELSRSKLERDGFDHVGSTTYRTSRYVLPHELGEIA